MSTTASKDPHQLLQENFGWADFKEGQLDVVQRLLDGKSTLSVFPTGGGKSLCYQLPACAFDGVTVVVSPLIALMKDQIDQLQSKGIHAVRLDSSLTFDEYREAMDSLRSGKAKLLYVAPERFFNERFRGTLESLNISLFAIDEAHCISQWGHNFRPDYLKLAPLVKKLGVKRILALTATATPDVQVDICNAFEIANEDVICTDFFRPNLHIRSQIVTPDEHVEVLVEKLSSNPPGATIVYVTLQKTAEQLANACSEAGLDAKAYHAGMSPDDRGTIQEWFMHGANRIVVATIAFGMGIDKSDIRYVYHFNPPKSIESYAQEIGRAGRDGEVSRCEMLLVPRDRITLENFVFGDTPSAPSIHDFLEEIEKQDDEFFISQYKLSQATDIKPLVAKTLLTYLELDGFLESTSPRYDSYSFKPLVSSEELLSNFTGERHEFAKALLGNAKKRKIWFAIDIPETMEKLDCERLRIIKALDYFAEKEWIELRVSGLVLGFRKKNAIDSVSELTNQIAERINEREKGEIERSRQVIDLARAETCQPGILSAHFGQPLESPCGQCSSCLSEGPFKIPEPDSPDLDSETLETIRSLVEQHPGVLNSSRSVARVLCGITSPKITRAKLSKHAVFGSCSEVAFDKIMSRIDEAFSF